MNYTLIMNIELSSFNVSIYKSNDYTGNVVDATTIQNNITSLNNQETAIELAQLISSFDGVSIIKVFNKSNNLVLEISSSL